MAFVFNWKSLAVLGCAGAMVLAFQNCSKAQFKEMSGMTFKADAAGDFDGEGSDIGEQPVVNTEEPVNTGNTEEPVVNTEVPDPNPMPESDSNSNSDSDDSVVSTTPGKSGEDNRKNPERPESQETESLGLVECELISPKQKVILDMSLAVGSNKAATRVCMSEHACLDLVNAYAAQRNCHLSKGGGDLSGSQMQCARIFPGSRGTCKNAKILSDEQVSAVLHQMANN